MHVRLPGQLAKDAKAVVKEGYFSTLGDFIRDVLRQAVLEHKRRHALMALQKEFGSMKGRLKRLSPEQTDAVLEGFAGQERSETFRKYGLDKA